MEKTKKLNIFSTIDLTKGTPWKVILLFALPILLSTLLNSAFSLINSLVLKVTVGGDSVTAINATGPISNVLFQFAYGCSSGFAVLAANKKGANDLEGVKKSFYHSITLGLIFSFIITLLGLLSYKQLILFLKIDPVYQEKAFAYYQLILLGFVFLMLNNTIANFLRSIGNSIIPLLTSIIATVVNIVFAFLLTSPALIFKLDTLGVAIATLLANLISVIINFIYIIKKIPYLKPSFNDFKLEKQLSWNMLKIGLPLGFQWSILFIGSFVQSRQVNEFGKFTQKAISAYSPFEGYLYIVFSVLGAATLSYVGQNYGAKTYKRINTGIKTVLLIDTIFYLLILIIVLPLVTKIPYIFLPKNEITNEVLFYSSSYLYVVIPFMILQGIIMMSRSALQGVKLTLIPFISGVGELFARIFICLLIPHLVDPANPLSNKAYISICFSTPFAWVLSALIMGGSVLYIFFIKKDKLIQLNKKEP